MRIELKKMAYIALRADFAFKSALDLAQIFSHLTFDNEHKKQIWLAHQRQNYRCMDLDRNDNSWTSSSDGSSGSGTLRWTPGPPFFSALFSFPAISYLVETKQLEGLNMGTEPEQLPFLVFPPFAAAPTRVTHFQFGFPSLCPILSDRQLRFWDLDDNLSLFFCLFPSFWLGWKRTCWSIPVSHPSIILIIKQVCD